MEDFKEFDISDFPNSSYNLILGARRTGKSYLMEYILDKYIKDGLVDFVFLFSPTNNGFKKIDKDSRFSNVDNLETIVENFRLMNEYNKIVGKRNQIKFRAIVIIDDMALTLKQIPLLEDLAIKGRHVAYEPLSLSFFILSQSLIKAGTRTSRLNFDTIIHNRIRSRKELELVMDEFYHLGEKRDGKEVYENLLKNKDFGFVVIALYKQNIKNFNDYIYTLKAE